MALFRCASGGGGGGQITVTYDSDFYGQTITCTRGQKVYSKVASSSGSVVFVVNEEGDWLIECTIGQDTYSTTASIEFTTSTELVSIPDGTTVLPTDDVETWLACAGIQDKAYTTLTEVLADSETFNALLGDSNACAYMARSTTFASTLCADQYAMSMIGQYDVCSNKLLSNDEWANAIINSNYSSSVITAVVPAMTSNTTPTGVAAASSELVGGGTGTVYYAYRAFNRSATETEVWATTAEDRNTGWIQYTFTSPKVINTVLIRNSNSSGWNNQISVKKFKIQASNDGFTSDSHDLGTFDSKNVNMGATSLYTVDNTSAYTTYRLQIIENNGDTRFTIIHTLQFYGRDAYNELIHGTNNESAYYLDGATQTPIVDPSTLSAGTYTFGSTVAKDPSDLTADYTKTIRITPNTKEIVLRPDCALYWYGYKTDRIVTLSTSEGWATYSSAALNYYQNPTYDDYKITCTSQTQYMCGIGSTEQLSAQYIHFVMEAVSQGNDSGTDVGMSSGKTRNQDISDLRSQLPSVGNKAHLTNATALSSQGYLIFETLRVRTAYLYAVWYE